MLISSFVSIGRLLTTSPLPKESMAITNFFNGLVDLFIIKYITINRIDSNIASVPITIFKTLLFVIKILE